MRLLSGLVGLALMAASPAFAEVVVDAPGGLAEALAQVAVLAAKQGQPFKLIIGHSPAQARQIADGAPGDIFISADPQWIAFLRDKGLLDDALPKTLASTHLVVIAPADGSIVYTAKQGESLAAQLGDGKLGICDPDMVPAGRFARAALEKLGAWSDLDGKVARLPDVRSVTAMVARREVPAGIVFASDLGSAQGLRVVTAFPPDIAPAVVFPMVVVAGHRRVEVEQVQAFIAGPEAAAVMAAHGFDAPGNAR